MIAIILAAGKSERLKPLTKEVPKTLLKVNGRAILERIFENIHEFVDKIFIVTGFAAEKIEKELNSLKKRYDKEIITVYNPQYASKNNCYSVLVGLQQLRDSPDDILLINGDDVFTREIIEKLLREAKSKPRSILVIDNVKELGEEEMKVLLNNNKIVKISKKIDPKKAFGEFIGISIIRKKDLERVIKALEYISEHHPNLYYEDAYQRMIDQGFVFDYVTTDGAFWNEIDTLEDLFFTERALGKLEKF